jgi:K+-sensing histidine kinase KdpD
VKDADLSSVKADLRLIQICFESLIDNAIKYSPENAVIIINAYSDSRFTTIEFTDHGVGFSAVALKNIFRFFSVGHKHIDQNPGLNIAFVKLIMDAHHGEIKVMNNKQNGAKVKLIFKNK